jgi:SAM-dependent methyltransferase
MELLNRVEYGQIYRHAGDPEDLPWHRNEPPALLRRAFAGGERPGRVLDLGCGSGVFAVWMAQQGAAVTAIDFMPRAVEMTRQRASRAGVDLHVIEDSVLRWDDGTQFDLVLDSGCLHGLGPLDRYRYRQRLVRWLGPGGNYVLLHFKQRHPLDWRPLGPRRRRREEILRFFTPQFDLFDYDEVEFAAPLPVDPRVTIASFWFKRAFGA